MNKDTFVLTVSYDLNSNKSSLRDAFICRDKP
jgi:hypothetical protein